MSGNPPITWCSMELRQAWVAALGGIPDVSVRNQEWLSLLVDDGRNTLAIEGDFRNVDELEAVLTNPKYREPSAREIKNFFDAAMTAYEFTERQREVPDLKFEIREDLILTLHAKLYRDVPRDFTQKAGEWAAGDRELGGTDKKGSPPHKIAPQIRSALWFLHQAKDLPPTRKSAIFHAFFERIHPFPNGNGRIGRILLNAILIAHGFPNVAIKGWEEADRQKYYAALAGADAEVDRVLAGDPITKMNLRAFDPLENLIREALAESLDRLICGRFFKTHPPIPVRDLATELGKNPNAFAVSASRKHIISILDGGKRLTHRDLLDFPQG